MQSWDDLTVSQQSDAQYQSEWNNMVESMPSSRTITVSIRNVYGNRTIYPECDTAKLFAGIASTTSLTLHTIAAIKKLGYDVVVARETL